MRSIQDYQSIVGEKRINEVYESAKPLIGKHIVFVSSTHQGGGVAEMLNSLILFFNELGVHVGWRIIHGTPDYFEVTKSIHNALQGEDIDFTQDNKDTYLSINKKFSIFTHFNKHDLVVVHDPQPLALIDYYNPKKQDWIWRCHIDLTKPNEKVWKFLRPYVEKYQEVFVSNEEFKQDIKVEQNILYPAIDPLADKNKRLKDSEVDKFLTETGIPLDKPLIAQISRFDKWKDPEGVIKVFEKVKEKVDCRLVLLGNTASDDPEGVKIYNEIMEKYGEREDIIIKVNVENNDLVVNALQTKSDVIIQKSTKEGFGLVVAEAMIKGTPVVGSKVGGIPLQIINNENGFLHNPEKTQEFSNSVVKLLQNKEMRENMGKKAREHVIQNFTNIRLLKDWLGIFNKHIH